MKRLGFIFSFVAIVSLLFTSTAFAQSPTVTPVPGAQQNQANTYTTNQNDTLGDLLGQFGVNASTLMNSNNNNQNNLGLLNQFINLNPNLAFQQNYQVNLPNNQGNNGMVLIDQSTTLQNLVNQYNISNNNNLDYFFYNNRHLPVQAGQTVQMPTSAADNNGSGTQINNQKPLQASVFAGSILNWAVYGQNNNLVGEVRAIIYDPAKASVPYIVVLSDNVFSKHQVLMPWGSFTTTSSALGYAYFNNPNPYRTLDMNRDMQLKLNVTEAQFSNAPNFDFSEVNFSNTNNNNVLGNNWDQNTVNYWNGILSNLNLTPYTNGGNGLLLFTSGIFDQIDVPLYNTSGNRLGHIDHLVVNPDGSVPYGLFQPDNLNLYQANTAINMSAVNWYQKGQVFTLNVPEGTLSNAPVFNNNNLPNIGNPNWYANWDNFWNPYLSSANVPVTGNNPTRSQLLGDSVVTQQNNTRIGSVQDVIMNNDNTIGYLVVYDPQNDQFRPIPWSMFNYNANNNNNNNNNATNNFQVTYTGTANQFHNAPGYNNLRDITPNQNGWNTQIDNYWNNLNNQ